MLSQIGHCNVRCSPYRLPAGALLAKRAYFDEDVHVLWQVAAVVGAAQNLAMEIQTDGIQVFGNIDPASELG